MSKDEPAFAHGDRVNGGSPGLTKREYAAIQIMAALLPNTLGTREVAVEAIDCADALLAELEKTDG